jgi:hypothetical protein
LALEKRDKCNQSIQVINTCTDLSLVEVRLGHIVSQANTLVVAMQPRVITTRLVSCAWNIYSMMQVSWTTTDTVTVTLDTAVVIVAAILGVQHHPVEKEKILLTRE